MHDWDGAWPGACMARGVCMAGGCAWLGGVHGRGVCMARGACAACTSPTPRPDTTRYGRSMSGRYASYWNAFLFWSENKAMTFPDGFIENPI